MTEIDKPGLFRVRAEPLSDAKRHDAHQAPVFPFSETGVFGIRRDPPAPPSTSQRSESRVATKPLSPRALAAREQKTHARANTTPEEPAPPQRQPQSSHLANPPRRPENATPDRATLAGGYATLPAPSVLAENAETASIAQSTQRKAALAKRLQAQTSPVLVAIHASECGLHLFARVGRMSPTERGELRHALLALLSQHGVAVGEIVLCGDGETLANQGGG